MPFRFTARYALVTYAQCGDLDPWDVCNHFSTLNAECIIGRENHSDGGLHLHAFVDFGKRPNFKRPDCFDVAGCHPNIKVSTGRPWIGYDYAIKDGDVVAGGLARPEENKTEKKPSRDVERASIIAASLTSKEFWENCTTLAPDKLIWSYHSTKAFHDATFKVEEDTYTTPQGMEFCLEAYPELDQWVRDWLVGHQRGGELSCPTRRGIPPSLRSVALQAQGDPCPHA